ncbi:MAG: hypothetical protein QM770_21205 [Tepidisphaeraceae bacterium]
MTDGFIHPGVGLTKEILESARARVLARNEPWLSGYQALASSRDSVRQVSCRNQSKTDSNKPENDAFDTRGVNNFLIGDSYKALRQALMFYFTGDEAYRANAMHIIRVWSQMDPAKYKAWPECYIHSCYPIQRMTIAAEILRYTGCQDPKLAWTDQDTQNFTNNFVNPCVETFLTGNGWFMNQNGYPIVAGMSGDIFTNDRQNYAKRVEWFTVNKDAPNKGWSSSIKDLARLVDRNMLTGEKVNPPVVQLMEMGRDQAHAADDVEIYNNTARLMTAQGTKVDPVTGTISTKADAVGPYEFLDDRILAAADFFCRFMLGYDTPWVPVAYDIAPDGRTRAIYPRIADNYRGRIRGLDFWDIYYHYTCVKGVDLTKRAPYYHEAFVKRIVASDTDWIFIPANVTGDGAKVPPREQQPNVVEVELRSNLFGSPNATVANEADRSFVRVKPTEQGTRIAILSADTGRKIIGLRVRTTGVAELTMSAVSKAWLIPNTQGQWRTVTYNIGALERFRDIVFMTFKGSPESCVDVDTLIRDGDSGLAAPAFVTGSDDLRAVAYVGASVKLSFASTPPARIASPDKPDAATLDSDSGAFSWTPTREGDNSFTVSADDGTAMAAKRVRVVVARDRKSAVAAITRGVGKATPYVRSTVEGYRAALTAIDALPDTASEETFFASLQRLQQASEALRPLTPRLGDGSIDYPHLIAASNIGDSIGLLTDGNDDTFPVFTLAKDLNYVFDLGEGYQMSFDTFAIEGRLNFEVRTQGITFYGSNDGTTWTQLAPPIAAVPVDLTKVDVGPEHRTQRYRFLKVQKDRASSPMFEPSELRIYGTRYEVN